MVLLCVFFFRFYWLLFGAKPRMMKRNIVINFVVCDMAMGLLVLLVMQSLCYVMLEGNLDQFHAKTFFSFGYNLFYAL